MRELILTRDVRLLPGGVAREGEIQDLISPLSCDTAIFRPIFWTIGWIPKNARVFNELNPDTGSFRGFLETG